MPGKYRKYRKINYSKVAAFMRRKNMNRKSKSFTNLRNYASMRSKRAFGQIRRYKRF
jgi:hypothetical protein